MTRMEWANAPNKKQIIADYVNDKLQPERSSRPYLFIVDGRTVLSLAHVSYLQSPVTANDIAWGVDWDAGDIIVYLDELG